MTEEGHQQQAREEDQARFEVGAIPEAMEDQNEYLVEHQAELAEAALSLRQPAGVRGFFVRIKQRLLGRGRQVGIRLTAAAVGVNVVILVGFVLLALRLNLNLPDRLALLTLGVTVAAFMLAL